MESGGESVGTGNKAGRTSLGTPQANVRLKLKL